MTDTISSVTSEAKNYRKQGNVVVSPRTGSVSFKFFLGEVVGDVKFGPSLKVYLEYDSLNGEDRYGLSSGWSLSVPHINTKSASVAFEDGSCRRIIPKGGELELQYLKQNDLKLYENGLGAAYLDGRHDIFDGRLGNLTKVIAQSGHCIDLEYLGTLPNAITGHKTSHMKVTSYPWGLMVEARMADGSSFSTCINLSSDGKVVSVLPGTKNTDPITFEYYADKPTLLKRITMSTGGIHEFEYVDLKLPGSTYQTMPAASMYAQIADVSDPGGVITTRFKYGGDTNKHSYLGTESGVVWKKGIDSLFEVNSSYEYEVWAIDCDRKTQYLYNKFHQLVSSTVYSIDAEFYALKKVEYEYSNKASDKFIDLPDNYQHPIKITTSFSSDGYSWGRRTYVTQKHDSYGNLIESVDVMGRKSVYKYCTPKNRNQHPEYSKIPDGSLFSIKLSERHYDADAEHYEESTYKHVVLDGVGDEDSFMPLTSMISSSYDGSVFKRKINEFYSKDDALEFYGYIRSFIIKTDESLARYRQSYKLSNNDASLRVKTEMLADGDCSNKLLDYQINEFSMQYIGKLVLIGESKDGVIEKKKYDSNRRIIELMTTKGTSSTTTSFVYTNKSCNNHVDKVFASGVTTVDADPENTYTERTTHDGLGQVCSESRQLILGGELVDMVTYKHGHNGMLASKSEWISDGTALNTLFKYDSLRRVTKKTDHLSVVTYWAYDDAKNTVMVSHKAGNEKLASTFNRANDEGHTIEVSVYDVDNSDEPYSTTLIGYDGFGRESERTINDRVRIKHIYDDALFKKTVIRESLKVKEEEHQERFESIIIDDPMNMKAACISMVSNPNKNGSSPAMLGQRTFDGFGRLIDECDPGGNKYSFVYLDGLLMESKDPLGTTAKRTYQKGLLEKVEYHPDKTMSDSKRESVSFLYDSNNLLKEVNQVGQKLYSEKYEYHHDRSMAKKTMVF